MEKKNKQKWTKINPGNNAKNIFPRTYYQLINYLRFKSECFLDTTNFIKSSGKMIPWKHLKSFFTLNLITEKVHDEIQEKIQQGQNVDIKKFNVAKVISFEEMRLIFPDTCPLYYNFISCMHNPAILDSPIFYLEALFSQKAKNKILSDQDEVTYQSAYRLIMGKLESGRNINKINAFGEKISDHDRYINESIVRRIKKKKEAINKPHHNALNDCKSLSLALIYCLKKGRNITYITSDIDNIANLYTWIDAISQQLTLKIIILNRIKNWSEDEKNVFWQKGRPISLFIDYEKEFIKHVNGMRADILAHDWKKVSFGFTIKYWSEKDNKFINYMVKFDKSVRELLLHLHDNCSCPYVKNIDYGNWFKYTFWPLAINNKYFKVSISRKKLIVNSSTPPWIKHDIHCRNSNIDPLSIYDFRGYSQFK